MIIIIVNSIRQHPRRIGLGFPFDLSLTRLFSLASFSFVKKGKNWIGIHCTCRNTWDTTGGSKGIMIMLLLMTMMMMIRKDIWEDVDGSMTVHINIRAQTLIYEYTSLAFITGASSITSFPHLWLVSFSFFSFFHWSQWYQHRILKLSPKFASRIYAGVEDDILTKTEKETKKVTSLFLPYFSPPLVPAPLLHYFIGWKKCQLNDALACLLKLLCFS